MTIFVGHSNTGKSYLAMLIYATNKVLLGSDIAMRSIERIEEQKSRKFINFMANIGKSDTHDINEIKSFFEETMQVFREAWRDEIMRCFGENAENLIEKEEFSCVLSNSKSGLSIDLTNPASSVDKIPQKLLLTIYKHIRRDYKKYSARYDNITPKDDDADRLMRPYEYYKMLGEIWQQFLKVLYGDRVPRTSHYLPAIRGGIMQSHRTLASAVIRRASRVGIERDIYDNNNIPLFNGVLADFMVRLIDIGGGGRNRRIGRGRRNPSRNPKFRRIDEYMESKILLGKVEYRKSETGYPDFIYSPASGSELPLMNASSSVSELAPVALFIRHYLGIGDCFILEEPEAHLHPSAQKLIAKVLVRLVDAGVYVLITTHSDIILDQIANCVRTAAINGGDRKGVASSDMPAMAKDSCSAYLFKNPASHKGKRPAVESVRFDKEVGFMTKDHLAVESDLYNETIMLLEEEDNVA